MIEKTTSEVYEETLKPLILEEKFGLASDLIKNNPELKVYMSKGDMYHMMNYYERILYTLSDGLERLIKRAEETEK